MSHENKTPSPSSKTKLPSHRFPPAYAPKPTKRNQKANPPTISIHDNSAWLELGIRPTPSCPDSALLRSEPTAAYDARLKPKKDAFRSAVLSCVPPRLAADADGAARYTNAMPLETLLRKLDGTKSHYSQASEESLPSKVVFEGEASPREQCLKFYQELIDEVGKEHAALQLGPWKPQ